ncbi:LOW QUALITY PROTEIN: hypothetical protein PHMEG_0006983 [Phytophthora megakarya]|uniref:Uncharacterized protein n=1 Tax=Phytophthora megakarya TaxID=4795 RepID=A0A225WMI3_9STRA|nr:LOW QUALITY PROTEIN: hypothetical protein PHMEG_0006983 [Phytophthora megakarya]
MDTQVAELQLASLIRPFPEVNDRYPMNPYISRVRQCLFSLQVVVVPGFLQKRLAGASAVLVNGTDLWEPPLEVLSQPTVATQPAFTGLRLVTNVPL